MTSPLIAWPTSTRVYWGQHYLLAQATHAAVALANGRFFDLVRRGKEFTAIGDTVNLSQRLESIAEHCQDLTTARA